MTRRESNRRPSTAGRHRPVGFFASQSGHPPAQSAGRPGQASHLSHSPHQRRATILGALAWFGALGCAWILHAASAPTSLRFFDSFLGVERRAQWDLELLPAFFVLAWLTSMLWLLSMLLREPQGKRSWIGAQPSMPRR